MSNGSTIANIKPTDLRGILKYVPRFQGQIFIIALDGAIVADDNFGNLLIDIAVLRSLGIKVVLVHGIGHQIKELSAARHVPISDAQGTGVTDAATLDLAIGAATRVSHLIIEGLTQNGMKCAITNSVRAIPVGIIKGVEQQFTGKVDRIDKEFILHLINADIVPIVSPIGFAPDGHSLRINSDLARRRIRRGAPGEQDHLPCAAGRSVHRRRTAPRDPGRGAPGDSQEPARDDRCGGVEQGRPCRQGDRDRDRADPPARRPGVRRPAERDLLQRGGGNADLRQRLPADPQGHPPRRAPGSTISRAMP